jgi:hypothetical protein
VITLALAIVALVLGAIDVLRSQGQSLVAWAVIALAAIHILGAL